MMGHTHALSGAVAFTAVAFPLSRYVHHLTPATAAVGAVVAAGAGLLPDLDHPQATPARAFGPLSRLLAHAVCRLSGGHRHGTHSLLGAAVATILAAGATLNTWALTAAIWLCLGLGVRALWRRPKNRPNGRLDWRDVAGLVHAAVAACIAYRIAVGADTAVVPYAIVIGYLTHLVGDSFTEEGVPWLWPRLRYYRIGSIDTGKSVERLVVVPALYAGLAVTAYLTYGTWGPALLNTIERN